MSHLQKIQSYKSLKHISSVATLKTISPAKKANHSIVSEKKQSNLHSQQKNYVDTDNKEEREITAFKTVLAKFEAKPEVAKQEPLKPALTKVSAPVVKVERVTQMPKAPESIANKKVLRNYLTKPAPETKPNG